MKMYIKAEDFLGILRSYYSETLDQPVSVKAECYYTTEGYYTSETKVKKVRFSYDKEIKIYNRSATQTISISNEDIKEAFSKILDNYDVKSINSEITESDYYSSSLDFIGVELSLKERQKKLELEM
jgi:hypothetical protein